MKTKLAQTAAALLLALSLTQAQADVVFEDPPWNQFNQGVNAYTDRDYRRALELLLPLAQSSNYTVRSVAEPYVARIYAIGPEGVKNLREAAYWMHRAAEDGDMSTQYYLGTLYLWGYKDLGIRRDARQAAKWFEQSARQRHEKAAAELALLYQEGADGLPQDTAAAAKWYEKAAEAGDSRAAAILSQMYAQGIGVKRDMKKAEKWRKRSEQDHPADK